MKQIFKILLITAVLFILTGILFAQPRLEIHHIDVGDGDATVVAVYDILGDEVHKILIDGGRSIPTLLGYLANFENTHFDIVILTHYHRDHYEGLLALSDGSITADYLIDPEGYSVSDYLQPPSPAYYAIQPKDTTCPDDWVPDAYIQAVSLAARDYNLDRYQEMNFTADSIWGMADTRITLCRFPVATGINIDVNLQFVAGWGYTMGDDGEIVDNWIDRAHPSQNNGSLALIIEAGEFRYFIGGDLGGDAHAPYIDQETTLIDGLSWLYPGAHPQNQPGPNYFGHICGFKANHHGSVHSNNNAWVDSMHAAVCVTSVGTGYAPLPSDEFLTCLNNMTPVTSWRRTGDILKDKGIFFTNLSHAKFTFINTSGYYTNPWDSFNYRNSYIINVPLTIFLTNSSNFYVYSFNSIAGRTLIARIRCHSN